MGGGVIALYSTYIVIGNQRVFGKPSSDWGWGRSKAAEQVNARRELNERFTTFQPVFVVFAEPPEAAQPGKTAFDDPAARQHPKAWLAGHTRHYFDLPAQQPFEIDSQVGAAIACIHPEPLQTRHGRPVSEQRVGDQARPLSLADLCGGDHDFEQPPLGIYQQMAFAAHHALAAI